MFFREIFELDNYSPIPVETEEEYKLVVSRFPFHDAEIEKVTCRYTPKHIIKDSTQRTQVHDSGKLMLKSQILI